MYAPEITNSYVKRYFFCDIDVPRQKSMLIDLYRIIINFVFDSISSSRNHFQRFLDCCLHHFRTIAFAATEHCP